MIHLLNGLISYWPLDAGTIGAPRADLQGSNVLVDVAANQVGYTAGIINNCATFTPATPSPGLVHTPSNASLQVTGDFTFSVWVNLAADTGTAQYILAKDIGTGTTNREYGIGSFQTSGWLFFVNDPNTYAVATGVPVVYGVWVHIIAWYTLSDQKMRIRINDTTTSVSSMTAPLVQGTADFRMGQRGDSNFPLNGGIDEAGFWKRLLTADEMTKLYNNGNGWPFANFTN
jgi:hypothetical protein